MDNNYNLNHSQMSDAVFIKIWVIRSLNGLNSKLTCRLCHFRRWDILGQSLFFAFLVYISSES